MGTSMKCYCGLDKDYKDCCEAIILNKKVASSPEELMRSRYSAYTQANGSYLVFSTIKENRNEEDVAGIEAFANSIKWLKLDVLCADERSVEFKAYYKEGKEIHLLHEKSSFTQEDGMWKYADGELYNTKIERNESCPCQSGKKYKKCCARG